jgi:sirohydrochlorin ferrochelatase
MLFMEPNDSPDAPIAVLLIAHGSRRPEANQELHDLAGRLAAMGQFPIVESAFLELAEPDIAAGADHCVVRGAVRVLLVPYFLSMGVHLTRDLTTARDQLAARHPFVRFTLGEPLGPHPLLDRLVLERISQTEAATVCEGPAVWPAPGRAPDPPGNAQEPASSGAFPPSGPP